MEQNVFNYYNADNFEQSSPERLKSDKTSPGQRNTDSDERVCCSPWTRKSPHKESKKSSTKASREEKKRSKRTRSAEEEDESDNPEMEDNRKSATAIQAEHRKLGNNQRTTNLLTKQLYYLNYLNCIAFYVSRRFSKCFCSGQEKLPSNTRK